MTDIANANALLYVQENMYYIFIYDDTCWLSYKDNLVLS